jgi:hypothetical protein
MHGSVRDRLESLLAGDRSTENGQDVENHLSSCTECSTELKAMKGQSNLLGLLRPADEIEPTAGFYARVMQRIEESTPVSVWSFFINSPFSKRLAYASLAVALLLGTYVITEESQDGHIGARFVTHQAADVTPVIGDQQEQRDAVLVNFASYQPGTGTAQ